MCHGSCTVHFCLVPLPFALCLVNCVICIVVLVMIHMLYVVFHKSCEMTSSIVRTRACIDMYGQVQNCIDMCRNAQTCILCRNV